LPTFSGSQSDSEVILKGQQGRNPERTANGSNPERRGQRSNPERESDSVVILKGRAIAK